MLELQTDGTDDCAFVRLVSSIIEGAVAVHQPTEFHVTKVDHWFDRKWMGFSGKVLGALGVWQSKVTIPPFVANRRCREWHFSKEKDVESYVEVPTVRKIYHDGRSEDNLHRAARRVAPNAALFWYSGDTQTTDRGSMMAYIPVEEDYWIWYLGFECVKDWRITHRKGIHEYEVRTFLEPGNRNSAPPAEAGSPGYLCGLAYLRSTDQ